jgi:hypothetical protein
MAGTGGKEVPDAGRLDKGKAARFLLACILLGGGTFASLELALPLTPLAPGHEIAVFAGFFLVPFAILLYTKRKPQLGKLDTGFFYGILLYMLFSIPLLLLIPSHTQYFSAYRMAPAAAALWGLLTFIQVSSVDFFTKRIIQLEVWNAWGAGWGMAAQFAAWSVGHVPEYMWLKDLAGPAGAVLFLGFTGALTGLLYYRTRNVLGMMAGHWLLNVLLAAAAVLYLA